MGKMINLKKKPETIGMASDISEDSKKASGKSLHIWESPKLPLTDKDVGKKMKAEIEFIPREVGMRSTNGQETYTYDLEITGIMIEGKNEKGED